MPGTILGPGNTLVNSSYKIILALRNLYFIKGDRFKGQIIKLSVNYYESN